jgi:hypothetical protein
MPSFTSCARVSPGVFCGTSEAAGEGGERISGRKRHLVVDTQGLILHVLVHPADVHDRRAAKAGLADLRGRYSEVECLCYVRVGERSLPKQPRCRRTTLLHLSQRQMR